MNDSLFTLENKTALVTGSSRGIGREIALVLARAGADIIVHGVRIGEQGESLVAEIREMGRKSEFIAGDLSQPGGGKALAEACLKGFGSVDVAVLNASVQIRKTWSEITPEEYDTQMRTNFQASLEMLQVLVSGMKDKGWGRILTVGSVQQLRPHPDMLVYAASKCAQMSMVTSLSKPLAPFGITVNNLAPGVILTDRNTDALADEAYAEKVKQQIPVRFFGEAKDCAGTALLLCSDAGRYITAQDIYVDGGMQLR